MFARFARLWEAFQLVAFHAVDHQSRRALFHIYRSLGDKDKYRDRYRLRIRMHRGSAPVSVTIRVQDIFVLAEMVLERQYELSEPLPDGATVLDAGANIGLSAIWFLSRHPDAEIHAFEPDRENFELLTENLAPYASVYLHRAAVGETDGSIRLWESEFGAMHSTLRSDMLMQGGRSVDVPMVSLAGYMSSRNIRRVDLLKLDVEGAEIRVLRGLGAAAARVRAIIGEVHEALIHVPEFYELIGQAGFAKVRRIELSEGSSQSVHGLEARR